MRTLAVMAHYDADGQVAPHALRNARALSKVADRLVVVSTAGLDDAAAAPLRELGEVIVRGNHGYDFFSWKVGLSSVEDLGSYDTVITCNDSYVGPLVPYERILATMSRVPADFWGLTQSEQNGPHVQSFFVAYRRWVARSRSFARFWSSMTPVSDRLSVIYRYELGLSKALCASGFGFGSYYTETPRDRRVAALRRAWWAYHRAQEVPKGKRRDAMRERTSQSWNPMAALADRALEDGRLPVVKIDTLRYDPYRLGADRLLYLCEKRFPDAFAGVRDYLDRTRSAYEYRPGWAGPGDVPVGVRHVLGYHR